MPLVQEFVPLELGNLHREAAVLKTEGWRFIQTHAVNTDDGIDLYYSFMKSGEVVNYRIAGVKPDQPVPSITDLFLAAFVFENEARELFGVDMRDIAIDFAGAMYAPAESAPMTFISPEQKAAREKARKAAAAKAAKEAAGAADEKQTEAAGARRGFVMTPERQARLDAKLATMSPDKVAKVQAALKAREAEAAAAGDAAAATAAPQAAKAAEGGAQGPSTHPPASTPSEKDAELEAKLSAMSPEKAAKVRAALQGKAAAMQPGEGGTAAEAAPPAADTQVLGLIGLMNDDKAAIVRKALNMKGGE